MASTDWFEGIVKSPRKSPCLYESILVTLDLGDLQYVTDLFILWPLIFGRPPPSKSRDRLPEFFGHKWGDFPGRVTMIPVIPVIPGIPGLSGSEVTRFFTQIACLVGG